MKLKEQVDYHKRRYAGNLLSKAVLGSSKAQKALVNTINHFHDELASRYFNVRNTDGSFSFADAIVSDDRVSDDLITWIKNHDNLLFLLHGRFDQYWHDEYLNIDRDSHQGFLTLDSFKNLNADENVKVQMFDSDFIDELSQKLILDDPEMKLTTYRVSNPDEIYTRNSPKVKTLSKEKVFNLLMSLLEFSFVNDDDVDAAKELADLVYHRQLMYFTKQVDDLQRDVNTRWKAVVNVEKMSVENVRLCQQLRVKTSELFDNQLLMAYFSGIDEGDIYTNLLLGNFTNNFTRDLQALNRLLVKLNLPAVDESRMKVVYRKAQLFISMWTRNLSLMA